MAASTAQYERITCEDVKVGDKIALTRTGTFKPVETIDEEAATRRLHFAREACPEPPLLTVQEGPSEGCRYCPDCNRWENSGDSSRALVNTGHGLVGGGNIRPRRTAKLWREVPARGSKVHEAMAAAVADEPPRYRIDAIATVELVRHDGEVTTSLLSEIEDAVFKEIEGTGTLEFTVGLSGGEYGLAKISIDGVEVKAQRID